MFLDRLLARNRPLIDAVVTAHQAGELLANTYVVDLDTVARNAAAIADAARARGLSTYVMAKQYGRNPDVTRTAIEAGLGPVVAVDTACVSAAVRHGLPVGHVGHLVQPHRGSEDFVVGADPEVVTVFSLDAARRIGAAARRRGGPPVSVLLRVHGEGDRFYFGHGGGFPAADVEAAARAVHAIEGVAVHGVTTFPALLADPDNRRIAATPNLTTLVTAAERLRAAGFDIRQVNAPGTTSARSLAIAADAGATHVEPGNAIHGTTPLHVFSEDAPEQPAIVYVTEVSHVDGDDAYAFAAGHYIDKVLGDFRLTALVGRDAATATAGDRVARVDTAPDGAIHYYTVLRDARRLDIRPGDTVVMCFRPQAFVTRGRTQAVAGLHAAGGAPVWGSRYDAEARVVEDAS
ncbi:alanine racemase [Embleya sp. NPDC020630]|uniref:alanine racemase n=1 Tax=Embleya sp. NPDC020630 TaxID=3363979 RepID=UPI00379502F9